MKLSNFLKGKIQGEIDKPTAELKNVLLCTDFDGTLVRFTGIPSETQLPNRMRKLLTSLAGLDELHLAIISGRRFQGLSKLVPVEGVTLAGNHGLKIRFEDGSLYEPEIGEEFKQTITRLNGEIRESFDEKDGIIIENKVFGLAVHYRQYEGDEQEIKDQFYEIWEGLQFPALEVIEGAKLLEARPANWNKGDAVRLLQKKFERPPTIYIGDDTTDEDAFRLLQNQQLSFPILVSRKEKKDTSAQYRLNDPDAVENFLRDLYQFFTK